MANYSVPDTQLTAIANAIRTANETNNTYTIAEMPTAINAIPTFTFLYEGSIAVNNTSTTSWTTLSPTISLGSKYDWGKNIMVYVQTRDSEGKRASHYIGSDCFLINYRAINGSTSTVSNYAAVTWYTSSSNVYTPVLAAYGLCPASVSNEGVLTMRHRYQATYTPNFNSTYYVRAWLVDFPMYNL